ncbi:glycosyltransferase family 66 protein [Atractiella rhizophila]|nr:glycosyltransferase family 66 protein [Atractiella rhizophila]
MSSVQSFKFTYPVPSIFSNAEVTTNTLSLLRIIIIALIAGAAVSSRLFAVVRFESIIHEFDPWFNYRATRVLVRDGVYEFWNWFDPTAWYPLGRVVGGTVYPGLMLTSHLIYNILHFFSLPVDIRNICVLLAPAFSGLTAYSTYLLGKEVGSEGTGLWAALFIGIVPGYISRSVAGSYDNEAIAIFILMTTFYLWIKALKLGSTLWGSLTALFYFYMVAAWGGYAFITNMLPLHALTLILMGRFTSRLYVAYSSFYAIGTLASMQVPFVGFQPVRTSEHMAALGVFGLLQIVAFVEVVRSHLGTKQFRTFLTAGVVFIGVGGALTLVFLTLKGYIAPWTGRFYSLWDTGYAKIHIPIIASVSEHQPTAWPSFFFDLQMLIYLFPAGVYMCFRELRDEHVFLIIYSVMASYFSGVMVRLMLVLTPVVCVTAAMVVSTIYETYLDPLEPVAEADSKTEKNAAASVASTSSKKKKGASAAATTPASTTATTTVAPLPIVENDEIPSVRSIDVRIILIGAFTLLLSIFCLHCTWVTQSAYSSPSVVLASHNPDGSANIIDDFREAYYWLRQNTAEDAKIMSWWDYGYQIAGFADRTTLVDNNTWNNTHIATVGKAMSTREEVAYPILRKHDVDYVLIIFGGLLGFSGDDINKFLWMIRISEGIWPDEVSERSFFTSRGEYKVDEEATPAMKNSLMYKMSYYRFAELFGPSPALDRVRNQRMPKPGPVLDTLEEAFTSENWIVRIYKVKGDDPLSRDLKSANSFEDGKKRKRKSKSK